MDFRIDAVLPVSAAQLWAIFFDVKRVATLIPGCEDVVEIEPLKEFSAVLKQKVGPFRLEVPTSILVESYTPERQVALKATGRDKATGTTIDVHLDVRLEETKAADGVACKLGVDASMQVAGRLASLGYPIVRKRSEDVFAEFERRLRAELEGRDWGRPVPAAAASAPPVDARVPEPAAPAEVERRAESPRPQAEAVAPGAAATRVAPNRNVELVLQWPRLGINVAVAVAVAHGAVAFGQSPWWWLAAPLLGVAASLGKRSG